VPTPRCIVEEFHGSNTAGQNKASQLILYMSPTGSSFCPKPSSFV
jgi:hypothetical protein